MTDRVVGIINELFILFQATKKKKKEISSRISKVRRRNRIFEKCMPYLSLQSFSGKDTVGYLVNG